MELHRPPKTAVAFGAMALCVGLLAACGDSAVPEPSPTPATSSESTAADPASDYTIPPPPENVYKPDEPDLSVIDLESAYQLARYYLDLYPYVKATGDATEWDKYAHPECEYCAVVSEAAEAANSVGAWSDFNLGVVEYATFRATGDVDYRIDFLVDRDEIVYYGPDGEVRTSAAEHSVVIGVKEVDGALTVRSFDILVPEVFGVEDL